MGGRTVWFTAACTLLMACVQPTGMPSSGDPRRGEAIARQWCADCHQVGPSEARRSPESGAPSFTLIATSRYGEAEALRRFLAEEHLPMPTFRLWSEEKEDVVAYILSLREMR